MPFMPAVGLNQWSGALPTWICFGRFFSIGLFLFCFAAACSAGSIFWLSTTSAVRTRASVGARFKLLSVGAGSKHADLCNEQISDSNERFNMNRGGSCLRKPRDKRAPLLPKKFICGILAGDAKFSSFLSSGGPLSVACCVGLHN